MKIWNLIVAALVFLFATHSAHALDPTQPFSSYIRTRFSQEENGLPTNIVTNIVQSRDGFLWLTLGTTELGRFDGQRFTKLPVIRTNQMVLGPEGDLWVGTVPDLIQISAAALNQVGPLRANSHPVSGSIHWLHFSRNGVLWAGTNQGLFRFENGVFSSVISQLSVERIEESANGDLLLATSQGFVVWDGSRAVPHPELAAQLGVKETDIFHVFEDSRGVTWICTKLGVARRVGNSIEKIQQWGPNHGFFRIHEDPQGNVWIAGDEGLFRATTSGLEPAFTGKKVRCMFGDRDGNLWVGTEEGLIRFKDRAVRMFTDADGLPGKVPMTVFTSHDGTSWIGFNCGGLAHYDGHTFRLYKEKDGLRNSCVWTLAEDANNDLWIGTFGGGAFRFRNGIFTQYSSTQGLLSDAVLNIVAARDGSLWFGTGGGVSRLQNGQIRSYTKADGLPQRASRMYEDRNGGILVGTNTGLYRLDGDRFVNVPSIPSGFAFPVGDDSSALYLSLLGESRGLYRLENNQLIKVIPNLFLGSMSKSEQGELWFIGESILRVPPGRLEQPRGHDEPLDFAVFGTADGMATNDTAEGYPNAAFTRDGKLWVATVQGMAILDLKHLPITDQKPVIYMEEFTVGRNQQFPGQELLLSAGTSHIELRFDAIEITSPEKIRLQYRMDGVDSEWLDATPPGHAIYSTLSPGTHAFHVRASNRDGIWDRTGMVYLITQKPFFYQTLWFRLALLATALLLVLVLHRLRLRQATSRLKALFDERLAERTRIARELHDTLLQTVQGSKLVADAALDKPDDVVHLLSAVRRLSGWLGQATQEGRAALNSLRTSTIETNDLAAALRRAIDECLINTSMAVKFSVSGGPKDLHPLARDEVYRISYEAIRNSCEHSSATELEVSLSYAGDLTLRVKDNGSGVDAAVVSEGKPGHFGLQGMKERAQRIESKFTLVSTPNSGTEITLVVPGRIIFRSARATLLERVRAFYSAS